MLKDGVFKILKNGVLYLGRLIQVKFLLSRDINV